MKKLIVTLMTVLLMGSTSGLVFAQAGTTASSTPAAKTVKTKKVKKVKKAKKTTAPAVSTTPAAK